MTDDSTAGGHRAARRGNGLAAPAYTPLADLDPRLADSVLEALRTAGVAAYVTPSTGTQGSYREVRLPDRPADRVWVDVTARPRAAEVLAAELAGQGSGPAAPAAVDEEDAWRAIVATFQTRPAGTPTWPAAEEVNEPSPTGGRPVRPAEPADRPVAADEDDDHYLPPVPPPVPQPHPVTRWAVLAVVGGLAVLLVPTFLGEPVGPGMALLAVLAVIGGFVTLVARMRDAPPTDSGPDDGAVV